MKKSQYFKSAQLLLIAVFLAGCVQTSYTKLGREDYPEVPYEDVVVYLHEDDVEGDFVEVAILHGEADASFFAGGKDKLVRAMKRKAAKIGANGILFEPIEEPSTGEKVAAEVLGGTPTRYASMVAIRVFED